MFIYRGLLTAIELILSASHTVLCYGACILHFVTFGYLLSAMIIVRGMRAKHSSNITMARMPSGACQPAKHSTDPSTNHLCTQRERRHSHHSTKHYVCVYMQSCTYISANSSINWCQTILKRFYLRTPRQCRCRDSWELILKCVRQECTATGQ